MLTTTALALPALSRVFVFAMPVKDYGLTQDMCHASLLWTRATTSEDTTVCHASKRVKKYPDHVKARVSNAGNVRVQSKKEEHRLVQRGRLHCF